MRLVGQLALTAKEYSLRSIPNLIEVKPVFDGTIMFKWLINLFRKIKMADFSTLDNSPEPLPSSGTSTDPNALNLTNPDSVLSGTNRGTQFVGSATLQIDSTKDLITVHGLGNQTSSIVRLGQVSNGFLGFAVNDGKNDTMFAGQDDTGTTVVKVAKTGFDVKTATSSQLIFNSSQDTFKIVDIVTIPLTFTLNVSAGSFGLISVPHNLSFTPAYNAYITIDPFLASLTDVGTVNISNPFTIFGLTGTTMLPEVYGSVTVDATNINFEILTRQVGSATLVNSAKVYLLQETAN